MTTSYLHHTHGRLRLRACRLRRDPSEGDIARRSLGVLPGVRKAEANPRTGSLTVHYDPATLPADRLQAALRVMGYLEGEPAPIRYLTKPALPNLPRVPATTRRAAGAAAGTIVKVAAGVLVEKAVERAVVAAVCAVL